MSEELLKILTESLILLRPVFAALIALFGAWVVQKVRVLQGEIEAQKPDMYAVIEKLAAKAVQTVEQLKRAGVFDLNAEKEKVKAKGIEILEAALAEHGITGIDFEFLASEIEYALWNEINRYKEDIR